MSTGRASSRSREDRNLVSRHVNVKSLTKKRSMSDKFLCANT